MSNNRPKDGITFSDFINKLEKTNLGDDELNSIKDKNVKHLSIELPYISIINNLKNKKLDFDYGETTIICPYCGAKLITYMDNENFIIHQRDNAGYLWGIGGDTVGVEPTELSSYMNFDNQYMKGICNNCNEMILGLWLWFTPEEIDNMNDSQFCVLGDVNSGKSKVFSTKISNVSIIKIEHINAYPDSYTEEKVDKVIEFVVGALPINTELSVNYDKYLVDILTYLLKSLE